MALTFDLIKFLEKNNSVFHDLSLGVMVGYHRILEKGTTTFLHDRILNETGTKVTWYCYKDGVGYFENKGKKTIFILNWQEKDKEFKTKKISNVIVDLEKYNSPVFYVTKNQKKIFSHTKNFLEKNESKIQVEDISSNNLGEVENIFNAWAENLKNTKNIWSRTYPSYYLAVKRCLDAKVPVNARIVYFDSKPFMFQLDEINSKEMAYNLCNNSLYFDKSFPSNLANYMNFFFFRELWNKGIKKINLGMPMGSSLKQHKEAMVGAEEICHTKLFIEKPIVKNQWW